MFKNFEICEFGSAEFDKALERYLLPFGGNIEPIIHTLDQLGRPPLGCQTVVFEPDYVDEDYQDEFSAFYSKAFKTYGQRCVRLHFFSCRIPRRTRTGFGHYRKQYLGFMVIRPTDLQRMGRTILHPPIVDPNREFMHCGAPFRAHILGERFDVMAMPFIQQDTQVGACAQASLWMVARYMSHRFGHREFLPAEINELAKANIAMGRAYPAEFGLLWAQMLDALDAMGFFAWSYSLSGIEACSKHVDVAFPVDTAATEEIQAAQRFAQCSAKLADIAYRYIESGLPVIFGTANHALVGIGHTYDPASQATVAIQRIPEFIVHNDAEGPYGCMPLFGQAPDCVPFSDVDSIIAVVPKEVTLRGEEAEAMARKGVEELLEQPTPHTSAPTLLDLLKRLRPDLATAIDHREHRTFLMPSTEFQTQLREDMKAGRFHKKIGDQLLRLDYPRFIWISEISSSTLLNRAQRNERKCLGRVVIDSTAPANTKGQMAMHFCDVLHIRDRQAVEQDIVRTVRNSTPFSHKIVR